MVILHVMFLEHLEINEHRNLGGRETALQHMDGSFIKTIKISTTS